MFELLFLLGFSLHNLEEALWLPQWSKHAGQYHKEVSEKDFRFAVSIVTAWGYLITFQYFIFSSFDISKYIYLGFVLMMVLNVIFPHLIATIALKKYAPGTITGLICIAPIGGYLLLSRIRNADELIWTIIASIILTIITLKTISMLFKVGSKIID